MKIKKFFCKNKKMRVELIFISLLSVYSLISLSINSWFHNVNRIYDGVDSTSDKIRLFSHAFQASFAFDILIFVWSLIGIIIVRKPLKFLCFEFSFYLMLLCIGKLVSTCIFLGNPDCSDVNEEYSQFYDKFSSSEEFGEKARSWKASYENMYASVILEWLLSGAIAIAFSFYSKTNKVQKPI